MMEMMRISIFSHGSQWNVTKGDLHQNLEPAGRATSIGSDLPHPPVGKLCQTVERFNMMLDWAKGVGNPRAATSLGWPSICDIAADSQPAQQRQFSKRFQKGQESDGQHPLWWQVFSRMVCSDLLQHATTASVCLWSFLIFSTIFTMCWDYVAIWHALGLP